MTQLLILINIFLTLSTLAISDTATLVVSDIPTWPETSFATLLPRPTQGEVLTPGSTYTISWTPPVGTAVNIEINDGFPPSHGSAHVFGPVCGGWVINYHCGQIAKKAPNSGTYEWVIPVPGTGGSFDPGFQTDPKYMIWIFVWALVVDDKPQGPFYYYSGNFSFKRPPPLSLPLSLISQLATRPTDTASSIQTTGSGHSSTAATPTASSVSTGGVSPDHSSHQVTSGFMAVVGFAMGLFWL